MPASRLQALVVSHYMLPDDDSPWRALVEHASEMLCVTGPHGRLVYVNAAWRRILEYSQEEAAARHPAEFVANEEGDMSCVGGGPLRSFRMGC